MPHNTDDSSRRRTLRRALGCTLTFAGISHLTFARTDFRAQVPETLPKVLPVDVDQVVVLSGYAEIGLGAALLALPKQRRTVGTVVAAFFVAVFPGNLAQLRHHRDAFGLDSDRKRLIRLVFQPLLVLWALAAGERV